MAIGGIPPGNKPPGRRPSLRGVLMIDTAQGNLRVRNWPRPRGTKRTPEQIANNNKFRNIQWAMKYMAPQMLADFMKAVQGTPLLPRDLLMKMMYGRLAYFILDDGRILYPMANRIDVSHSLDAITQTPGQQMIRGENGWEAYTPPPPPTGSSWEMLAQWSQAADGNTAEITGDITGRSDVFVIFDGVTISGGSGYRCIQLSTDGGATWIDDQDYLSISPSGQIANDEDFLYTHSNGIGSARTTITMISGLNLQGPKPFFTPRNDGFGLVRTVDYTNAIRCRDSSTGILNGGSVYIYGR